MCQIVQLGLSHKEKCEESLFFLKIFPSKEQLQRRLKLFALNEGTFLRGIRYDRGTERTSLDPKNLLDSKESKLSH